MIGRMFAACWSVPFAYPQSIENLRSFVLIGLPASEAASALLMPVAGHELGHAVWRNLGIGSSHQQSLQTLCRELYGLHMDEFRQQFPDYREQDLVARNILEDAIAESSKYAGLQAEELFSDLFAYACFGASYLRAFAYLLAPGEGTSDGKYPTHATRINVLRNVGTNEGEELPTAAELQFKQTGRHGNPRNLFIVRMAEEAVARITDTLWKVVLEVVTKAKLVRPMRDQIDYHLANFRINVPSPSAKCVGNIIVAGWQRYDEIVANGGTSEKISGSLGELNEVLLKSIEVFEYRHRTE
jgi:hypothetical protein